MEKNKKSKNKTINFNCCINTFIFIKDHRLVEKIRSYVMTKINDRLITCSIYNFYLKSF